MKQIPLEVFFKKPTKSSFQLSPDGGFISYLDKNNSNGMDLKILDKSTKKTQIISGYKKSDEDSVTGYFWKTDKFIFLSIDNDGDENDTLYKYDLNTGKLVKYFDDTESTTYLVDLLDNNDNEIIVANNSQDKMWFDLYRINVYDDEPKLMFKNTEHVTSWEFDNDGNLRIVVKTNDTKEDYYFGKDNKFKKLLSLDFTETFSPISFDKDNKYIYALTDIDKEFVEFVLFDPYNGVIKEKIHSVDGYDVSGAWVNKDIELKAVYWTDWKGREKIFCPKIQEVYDYFAAKFDTKIYDVVIYDSTDDETEFLVLVNSDKVPGKLYYYDALKKKSKLIYEYLPEIHEEDLVDMRPFKFKSVDGLEVHGYLVLPENYESENKIPLIVIPHGGPWHRDTWGYDSEAQFFANRGYAVLQVNFRGSLGYGKNFWKAGFKEWGQLMQDDITDAVQKLIKSGMIDKSKIAIYGGSYGGYSTLMGLINDPDLYCCGINYVGVTNLLTFMETIPEYWKAEIEQMYTMVGNPKKDKEYMIKNSPVFNIEKIKSPLLVIHGKNDPRVNINEYKQLIEKLDTYNKEYDTLLMDDEGHGSKKERNTLQVYRKIEEFLNKYMR